MRRKVIVADIPLAGAGKIHSAVITAFADQGFEWSGAWRRLEAAMYFKFVDVARLVP